MKKIKLTQGELSHLLCLLLSNKQDGSYYAPKDQYWERHNRLLRKLKAK